MKGVLITVGILLNLSTGFTQQFENQVSFGDSASKEKKIYQIGENKRTGKDLFFITQNSPNPFTSYTSINYHFTIEAEAEILLYTANNEAYRTIKLNGSQLHGSIILSRDMFDTGKYTYVLKVNGEIIDAKVLVVND